MRDRFVPLALVFALAGAGARAAAAQELRGRITGGVTDMTGYDVGGSRTGTQTGFQTYGVPGQNKTLFEGINVTEGQDTNAGYFDFGSFEEFQLGGSGNMGEQSGVGAFLNLTVKSGGDKFSSQAYYDFVGEHTLSNNVPDAFRTPGGVDGSGFKAPTITDPATGERLGLSRGNPITRQYDF